MGLTPGSNSTKLRKNDCRCSTHEGVNFHVKSNRRNWFDLSEMQNTNFKSMCSYEICVKLRDFKKNLVGINIHLFITSPPRRPMYSCKGMKNEKLHK